MVVPSICSLCFGPQFPSISTNGVKQNSVWTERDKKIIRFCSSSYGDMRLLSVHSYLWEPDKFYRRHKVIILIDSLNMSETPPTPRVDFTQYGSLKRLLVIYLIIPGRWPEGQQWQCQVENTLWEHSDQQRTCAPPHVSCSTASPTCWSYCQTQSHISHTAQQHTKPSTNCYCSCNSTTVGEFWMPISATSKELPDRKMKVCALTS